MSTSQFNQRSIQNDFNTQNNLMNFDLDHQSTIHNFETNPMIDPMADGIGMDSIFKDQMFAVNQELNSLGFIKPVDTQNQCYSNQ
jgi:hypothetical protein